MKQANESWQMLRTCAVTRKRQLHVMNLRGDMAERTIERTHVRSIPEPSYFQISREERKFFN